MAQEAGADPASPGSKPGAQTVVLFPRIKPSLAGLEPATYGLPSDALPILS